MKSVVLKGSPGSSDVRAQVVELPTPSIGRRELLVEMKACGLCGTDIEKLRGEYTAAMPVLGHEAVGVVAKAGPTSGFEEGDRVFPHHHVPCNQCYYCRSGSETVCADYKTSNLDPGGFSQYFRVPEWNVAHGGVLRLPPEVGFEAASLIEPVACCLRALERCSVRREDTVLVVGAGPVGMMHALLLGARGARVVVSDVSESRLRFAEERKVGVAIDASKRDVPAEVREMTRQRGADMAITASGSQKAILQALRSVRKGGTVCLFGVPVRGSVLDYDVSDAYNSALSVVSSYGASDKDTADALSLISGRTIDFQSLITDRFRVEEFDQAVRTASGGLGMKVVVTQ